MELHRGGGIHIAGILTVVQIGGFTFYNKQALRAGNDTDERAAA